MSQPPVDSLKPYPKYRFAQFLSKGGIMSHQAKRQYLIAILDRYKKSGKKEKTRILDEFCAVCGYSRKYATRILNSKMSKLVIKEETRGVRAKYSKESVQVLKELWILTGKICSKRLQKALPEWVDWYKKRPSSISHFHIDEVLEMSPATIDRKLSKFRYEDRKGKSATKKSNWWFRSHIPIKADNLGLEKAGFVQADTVAHCGDSLNGHYAHTLTVTDLATTWTENFALWRKLSDRITEGFNDLENRFPFPFFMLKTDSGTEFMNNNVYTFLTCRDFPVELVRSRPYQKNDNCYVEQKNFTHVRTVFGYSRLDNIELIEKMNVIYKDYWNPLHNFFIPTMKLKSKEKIGTKWKKKYDIPKTPYQRVLDNEGISKEDKESLIERKKGLNPIELRLGLEEKLQEFLDLTKRLKANEQSVLAA